MRRCLLLLLFWCVVSTGLHAADSAFDLAGPKVDVHVRRGGVTLPISQVVHLMPGDRLWIHPDLPRSQSARYVLIVAFLRGATNPPPPEWFTRVETWTRHAREEGVFVVVPPEAQQALLFLAPATGGDFSTLRNAVTDRPGAFVRAAQDLEAASRDRMRLDAYLAEVRETSQTNPKSLKERIAMAARSLGIRLQQDCFNKPAEQQASCLMQNTEGLVLDDANVQSRVEQLTTGSTVDLMNQLSYSSMARGGAYSPYVGAIVDTAKILASLHTAHFQYIPALALPTKDTLNLRLNLPPSFRNPKSVVVVALPEVGAAKPPPLHPVDPEQSFCAQQPDLVLPAEDAPLVFATPLAHGLFLRIQNKNRTFDLPVRADAARGGMVLTETLPELPTGELTGVVRGKWGFDDWEGPRFHLWAAQPGRWVLKAGDETALVVGRQDTLHLGGENALCVERIADHVPERVAQPSAGEAMEPGTPPTSNPASAQRGAGATSANAQNLIWKSPRPGQLEVAVPLQDAAPGPVDLEIYQYGLKTPDHLPLQAYAEAAALESLTLDAGDTTAVLKGNRLDEVAKVDLRKIVWTPGALSRAQGFDQLALSTANPTSALLAGEKVSAEVWLRDGRLLTVPVNVEPPRPQLTLLSKGTQDNASSTHVPVHLGSCDDLPVEQRLVFFLRSDLPASFPRDEKVEVAAADGSFQAMLSLADGSLMLEDAHTVLGVVEPLARFGSSAFGPLRVRALAADGAAGDWLPLGTLVRLPGFQALTCPHALAKPCTLSGSNLFLAASIAATPEFDNPVDVPSDFTGTELTVPHPDQGVLYLKLRDDPQTVQTLTLPVTPATSTAALAPRKERTLP